MEQTRPSVFEERVMNLMPKEHALLLLDDIMLWRAKFFGWCRNVKLKGENCIRNQSGPFGLGEDQQGKAFDVDEGLSWSLDGGCQFC